jgi:7-carboxy-7-deazaguanine synthase
MDIKCPGSGMHERMHWDNIERLQPKDEVKFVVTNRADFDYAVHQVRKYSLHRRGMPLLVSPVPGTVTPPDVAAWILDAKLPLRLQLQLHKILWPNSDKGR